MGVRKFDENDICNIRALLADGITQKEVSEIYKVSHSAIGDIYRGRSYKRPKGKLSKEAVAAIKEQLRTGTKQCVLAMLYNVSQPTISDINRGMTWK